ncbi:MAG: fatty acid desaturase, partial [Chloroflexota bacterium]
WLLYLCNNTQHVGLQDDVADFRLCTRTIILNPVVRFLYWHMNYHIEHHMYASVPCYNLHKLHELIKHDLPPAPVGLYATWMHIIEVVKKQNIDPDYQYVPELPDPVKA